MTWYRFTTGVTLAATLAFAAVACQQRQEVDEDEAGGVADTTIDATAPDTSIPAPADTADTLGTTDGMTLDSRPPDESTTEAATETAQTAREDGARVAPSEGGNPPSSAAVTARSEAARNPTTSAAVATADRPAARTPTGAASAATPSSSGTPQPASTPAASDTPPSGGGEQASAQTGEGAAAKPSLEVSAQVYNGWKQFSANCERCHGQDAVGSSFAPALVKSVRGAVTHDVFVQTVTHGRLDKGMPAWGEMLSPQYIEDIYAYLVERGAGRLPPGRPKRVGG